MDTERITNILAVARAEREERLALRRAIVKADNEAIMAYLLDTGAASSLDDAGLQLRRLDSAGRQRTLGRARIYFGVDG